jgi:cysteinyl-tRNA synthetase
MKAVSLRLYDSLRRDTVEFSPIKPGHVSMYVCGPTVQSAPHVGHIRSALVYDLWWRWLEHRGYQVTLVRNVTDIDDKILEKSAESGEPWWQLAHRVETEFAAAAKTLRIRTPHLEPRATGDILAMIELISQLIDRGHAYVADDQSGDVYFDVSSWPDYGALTNQSTADMEAGEPTTTGKRSPHDFALWKGHKPHEPDTAQWEAPWGAGRPGWHIECSAMATRYLGPQFDVHGGGLDLRFPHHENELAQARAAGHPFATHWLHNALVLVNGQKMSKSLGNSVYARDWLASTRPIVARYGLLTAHYRSDIDIHGAFLDEAAKAFGRIEGFLDRSAHLTTTEHVLPDAFAEAMDDDLGTPIALAALHDRVRAGNAALDEGDADQARVIRGAVVAMCEVLGINPASEEWAGEATSTGADDALDRVVNALIARRQEAREAKDFSLSDTLRDLLADSGIVVEDGSDGSTWRIDG